LAALSPTVCLSQVLGDGGGASLRKLEYTYDDTGNRTSLTDTPAGVAADRIVWDYNYDWLNRLSAVERSMPGASPAVDTIFTTYLYDESDNRKEFTYKVGTGSTVVTTYTRNTADQVTERKVGGVTQETFAYDADGNMTSRVLNPGGSQVTTTYTWDDYDRLVRFQKSSPSTDQSQRYDSGNIRKTKTATDGTTFTYRYNGLAVGNETKTPPSSSPIKTALIMGHQLLGFDQAGTFFYFITDGLSSVRLVVDEDGDGDVVASYDADEFGNSILVDENGASTDQRWVGGLGYKDETAATGLYYLRQRYYAPDLGRFLSRDPLGGANLYSYCASNPTKFVDPNGTDLYLTFIQNGASVTKAYDAMADFVGGLSAVPANSITELSVVGHGTPTSAGLDLADRNSPERFEIGPSGLVEARGSGQSFGNLKNLLAGKLAPNARINFLGCNQAGKESCAGVSCSTNITRQTSIENPTALVSGFESSTIGSLWRWSELYTIGFNYNTFQNGTLKYLNGRPPGITKVRYPPNLKPGQGYWPEMDVENKGGLHSVCPNHP
jgi:RHS repeat-associated protein